MSGAYLGYIDGSLNKCIFGHRRHVPSKIGGRPAWLSPCLPTETAVSCPHCQQPLIFLCQVYAPRRNVYHRMIYILACWTCGQAVKALRINLPQQNPYLPESEENSQAEQTTQGKSQEKTQEHQREERGDQWEERMKECVCEGCWLPIEQQSLDNVKAKSKTTQRIAHLRCIADSQMVTGVLPEHIMSIEPEGEITGEAQMSATVSIFMHTIMHTLIH